MGKLQDKIHSYVIRIRKVKMNSIKLKARAKINLGLDVLCKREDGYHEVRMIMQTIGLYDRIIMKKIKEPEIKIVTNLSFLPVNENNLVHKAAKMLIDEFNIKEGVSIDLNKFIPVAAGMAGGSSDAASVLYGMNRLFHLNLTMEELMVRGVHIGADVPYCILRGTALAEGIGEKLTKLKPMPKCYIVVAKPPINVSTKLVYENLDMKGIEDHPDIDGIINAIEAEDIYAIAQKLENVLEKVTIPLYPVIAKIKNDMKSNGAINAIMSGSGPTVFGMFDDYEVAMKCIDVLKKADDARQIYITETYNL